jgi:hypothetical protein
MGKPIDMAAINEELDLDTSPEAQERFDAALKRGMGMPTTEREDELLRQWCTKERGW